MDNPPWKSFRFLALPCQELLLRQLNRCNFSRCQAERGARRGEPQPPVQRTHARQPARSIPTRTAPEDRPPRSRRPSLPVCGILETAGGVAESPEKLVAARRGGHPAPPLREVPVLDIFTCRSNKTPDSHQIGKRVVLEVIDIVIRFPRFGDPAPMSRYHHYQPDRLRGLTSSGPLAFLCRDIHG